MPRQRLKILVEFSAEFESGDIASEFKFRDYVDSIVDLAKHGPYNARIDTVSRPRIRGRKKRQESQPDEKQE